MNGISASSDLAKIISQINIKVVKYLPKDEISQ
jgi:hypothetical protein